MFVRVYVHLCVRECVREIQSTDLGNCALKLVIRESVCTRARVCVYVYVKERQMGGVRNSYKETEVSV